MANFGWSYPAGCSGTPADEPCGCDVCLKEVGSCICPECPVCGDHGNPKCYAEHGMTRNADQIKSETDHKAAMGADAGEPLDAETADWKWDDDLGRRSTEAD